MSLLQCLQMDRDLKIKISEICSLLDVDGIRGDITTNKAARALAAYQGETTVTLEHVRAVIGLCLDHRSVPPHTCCLLHSHGAPDVEWAETRGQSRRGSLLAEAASCVPARQLSISIASGRAQSQDKSAAQIKRHTGGFCSSAA